MYWENDEEYIDFCAEEITDDGDIDCIQFVPANDFLYDADFYG